MFLQILYDIQMYAMQLRLKLSYLWILHISTYDFHHDLMLLTLVANQSLLNRKGYCDAC